MARLLSSQGKIGRRYEKRKGSDIIGTEQVACKTPGKPSTIGSRQEVVQTRKEDTRNGQEKVRFKEAEGIPKLALEFSPTEDENAWLKRSMVAMAWCERCFVELGALIGEVILVDEDTSTVKVDGEFFPIMVMEEEWRMALDWWLAGERRNSVDSKYGIEYPDDGNSDVIFNVNGLLEDDGEKDAKECGATVEDSNWNLRCQVISKEGESVEKEVVVGFMFMG
ncbi:hypothetical protein SLEP1_g12379 [Rubroshorea leprosula]|uniref:Uncharacterized protein n=1 Tax=Rubroshorea leprosula TaxID=152421 RepID=A0AAV5IGT7_9ROSI|nr:hypothetical protein SLEP1_g12379 [Rubroshorea leprosula]